MSNQKVKYIDWFGSTISESTDDMIIRIKTQQKENTMLRKRLLDLELERDKKVD